jgi:putative membrane protein
MEILSHYQASGAALSMGEGAPHLRHLSIAGLFIVPRYYIHHQATTRSAEDRADRREDKARTIILTPAMLLVWVLG